MPIYVYKCPSCHKVEELMMKMTAPHPPCSDCHVIMEKQLTSAALKFLGSGFYINDYGKGKK